MNVNVGNRTYKTKNIDKDIFNFYTKEKMSTSLRKPLITNEEMSALMEEQVSDELPLSINKIEKNGLKGVGNICAAINEEFNNLDIDPSNKKSNIDYGSKNILSKYKIKIEMTIEKNEFKKILSGLLSGNQDELLIAIDIVNRDNELNKHRVATEIEVKKISQEKYLKKELGELAACNLINDVFNSGSIRENKKIIITRDLLIKFLTLREISILQLNLRGSSCREIANTFTIAETKVKKQLRNIYNKISVVE